MAKIKKHYEKRYTVTDNQLIEDNRLSWKARGIFTYLWAQSDDWEFYEIEVTKHAPDGRDSLRTGLKELEKFGYLKRTIKRDKGRFNKYDWILSDTPMLDFPNSEKPNSENPTLISTKETSTNNNNDDDDKNDFEIRQKIMREFQTNVANVSSSYVTEQINDWINTVGADLVMRSIEVAIENTAHSFKYVNSILTDWQKKNIKTVEQANDYMAEHDKKKAAFTTRNTNHNKRGVEDEDLGF